MVAFSLQTQMSLSITMTTDPNVRPTWKLPIQIPLQKYFKESMRSNLFSWQNQEIICLFHSIDTWNDLRQNCWHLGANQGSGTNCISSHGFLHHPTFTAKKRILLSLKNAPIKQKKDPFLASRPLGIVCVTKWEIHIQHFYIPKSMSIPTKSICALELQGWPSLPPPFPPPHPRPWTTLKKKKRTTDRKTMMI